MLNIRIMPPITEPVDWLVVLSEAAHRYLHKEIEAEEYDRIMSRYQQACSPYLSTECIHGVRVTESCEDCIHQIEAQFGGNL